MIAVTVARPTEDIAVGLASRRPTPPRSASQLLRLIAWARRVGDEHGRRLFEARLRRPVGEWS